ncbi:MAG: hypothetical protein FWE82_03540, partial [Defluviitaleaceae bacterium]|nr:hypothetical protein [Defluviitaleaceae bacterium]
MKKIMTAAAALILFFVSVSCGIKEQNIKISGVTSELLVFNRLASGQEIKKILSEDIDGFIVLTANHRTGSLQIMKTNETFTDHKSAMPDGIGKILAADSRGDGLIYVFTEKSSKDYEVCVFNAQMQS